LRADLAAAAEHALRAASLAQQNRDFGNLVRARAEQALLAAAHHDALRARELLTDAAARARAAGDAQAEALASAKRCECELAIGDAAAALEHGWSSLRHIDDVRERAALLENVGLAFAQLGLHKAAERCFTMVAQRGVDSALRARARALQAVEAAANGSSQAFRERRLALLNDAAEWATDVRTAAFVQVELGRGCLVAQDIDGAREHLRAGIMLARRHSVTDMLARAGDVLAALEQNTVRDLVGARGNGPGADAARRIADQLEALPDLPVIAT
jgi:hypothetical protein